MYVPTAHEAPKACGQIFVLGRVETPYGVPIAKAHVTMLTIWAKNGTATASAFRTLNETVTLVHLVLNPPPTP